MTIPKTMRPLLTFALIVTSLSAQEIDYSHLPGMGDVRYHQVDSQILGRPFHIYVRLPSGYSSRKSYPTVYLLDGGGTFPMFGAYIDNIIEEPVEPPILVGISYGARGGGRNFRQTDFTAPASGQSHYGGAPKFQEVLRTEIIALIEQTYSSDPKRRIIFGHSLGGQFVLYTIITSPDLFWGYIASNPAMHRNLDIFLTTAPENTLPVDKPRLFVGGASEEAQRYQRTRKAWVKHWSAVPDAPWAMKSVILEGHTHMSSRPEAFRQGLFWVFGK